MTIGEFLDRVGSYAGNTTARYIWEGISGLRFITQVIRATGNNTGASFFDENTQALNSDLEFNSEFLDALIECLKPQPVWSEEAFLELQPGNTTYKEYLLSQMRDAKARQRAINVLKGYAEISFPDDPR